MKCSISQPDFAKAISAVLGVVDKRGTMPILSNVLLKANGDGGIHVSATDLEVSYKGFCPASIEAPGAITVPAHQLASLVKDMPLGDLQVETTENHNLKIFQGEAKYRLHGLEIVSWTCETAEPPAPAKEAKKEEGGEEEETPPQEQEAEQPPDLSAFGFNIRFLLDPLAAMTAETVEMEGNFSNRPFRIRAVGDPSFFSIVMPMGL